LGLRLKTKGNVTFYVLLIPSLLVFGTFFFVVGTVAYNAYPAFEKFGLSIYTTNVWDPNNDRYGGLGAIYGTLVVGTLALVFSIPVSIAMAIFVNDIAPPRLREVFVNLTDLLASFPTVVYGFWGLYVLGPFLSQTLFTFLYDNLSFIPLFSTSPAGGPSFLLASIVLSLMITPFATSIIRETYAQVPKSLEEAVYALGLSRWELFRIKLGYVKRAFLGAYALAFGRGIGETVAVSLTVGNVLNITPSLLAPGYTISSLIINQFGTAFGLQYYALFALGLFLVIIGLAFIALSRLFLRWYE
jgi:phosphate transport system permease protein